MIIPFNRPFLTGSELDFIAQAHANGQLAGNGVFTQKCQSWLEQRIGCCKALLTHSCTAALEMAAILADIQPGDEVIIPSYTFVSTANAFVLRGGVPVFVDVRPDTLNIDESLLEAAITPKTKAIVPVHYGGVACEMNAIMAIAERRGLLVIEDAAQALLSTYQGRPLGSFGHMAAFSFHETKNIISGEGGALIINSPELMERAEVIWEKGTNRSRYFRGETDKYTWVDIGSSFLPGEIVAAFLYAQMKAADEITQRRLELWQNYHSAFESLEASSRIRRPIVSGSCQHNAHVYYLLLEHADRRENFINAMRQQGVHCVFHYVPLHTSPMGLATGRTSGALPVTEQYADRLVRLPLWLGLEEVQERVIESTVNTLQD